MLNPKLDVYSIEWLNVVFANRNQSYGAYELRKNYNWRLTKALMIASAVFIGGVSGPVIYRNLIDEEVISCPVIPSPDILEDKRIVVVELAQKKVEPIKPKEDAGAQSAAKAKITAFTPMTIVPDNPALADPPTQEALQNSVVGSVNQEGPATSGNVSGNSTEGQGGLNNSTQAGTGAGDEDSENIFISGTLEHQPEFPGGMEAFAKYLRKYLQYPAFAAENGIAGRVSVNFVVEKDGSLTDIKIAKGIGFGCDEEAMRVLRKSPKWSSGEQNGRKVRVMYTVPIVFSMGE